LRSSDDFSFQVLSVDELALVGLVGHRGHRRGEDDAL
jgi:hypothetical protein